MGAGSRGEPAVKECEAEEGLKRLFGCQVSGSFLKSTRMLIARRFPWLSNPLEIISL